MIRVTVWGENLHEQRDELVQKLYPDGMHAAIAAGISEHLGEQDTVRTVTLDQPEHGLTEQVLAETDVLTWWGHIGHDRVPRRDRGTREAACPAGNGARCPSLRPLFQDLPLTHGHELRPPLALDRGT